MHAWNYRDNRNNKHHYRDKRISIIAQPYLPCMTLNELFTGSYSCRLRLFSKAIAIAPVCKLTRHAACRRAIALPRYKLKPPFQNRLPAIMSFVSPLNYSASVIII